MKGSFSNTKRIIARIRTAFRNSILCCDV